MMTKEQMIWAYAKMNQIRCFEEKALSLFEQNKLRGSVHLYIGEEAVAAGVCCQLSKEDFITSTHRGHGHCLAKGADPKYAMAELMGKATGYCKGRGGSMHIADLTQGNLGANAIVGGGIPIATGAAMALKLQHRANVAVSFFGDGASNQGTFHESLNIASVSKLPIIFVCENNGYAISVPTSVSTSVKNIADRGAAYAMPSEVVDGNDVFAVFDAFSRAKERALSGEGPTLLEMKTYRWKGHWTGDPEVYRSREEVNTWMARCPIKLMREKMLANNWATEEELDEVEKQMKEEIEIAAEFALASPEPDPSCVMDDVFFEDKGE